MRFCRVSPRALLLACALAALAPAVRAAPRLEIEASDTGCPRRREVTTALAARLRDLDRWTMPAVTIRRLQLLEEGGGVTLRLWDDRGGVALERRLAVPPAAGGTARARDRGSCQALAEAAALVTVRYLREIGYRPPAASVPAPATPPPQGQDADRATSGAPTPPAPRAAQTAPLPAQTAPLPAQPAAAPTPRTTAGVPPTAAPAPPTAAGAPTPADRTPTPAERTSAPVPTAASPDPTAATATLATSAAPRATAAFLGAGGGLRVTRAGASSGRGEAVLTLLVRTRRLAVTLGAGASSETVIDVPGGAPAELRLRAFPLRFDLGWAVPLTAGALLPTAGFSADLSSFRATGLADARSGLRFDPAVEAGLGYLATGDRLYLRAALLAGLTLTPRDFQTSAATAYRTEPLHFRAQLEIGVRLWKNSALRPL